MPYAIRKRGSTYQVVNTATGRIKARHTTRLRAQAQLRLLRGIEHGLVPRRRRRARR